MTTLAAFLLERLAEDEAAALAASPSPWHFGGVESVAGGTLYDVSRRIADVTYEQLGDHDGQIVRHLLSPEANANGAHIARHDPARVLADVEAKRAIVALGPNECGGHADQAEFDSHHYPDPAWSHCDGCSSAEDADRVWSSALLALASVYRSSDGWREEWA